jgi:hypothetical protein
MTSSVLNFQNQPENDRTMSYNVIPRSILRRFACRYQGISQGWVYGLVLFSLNSMTKQIVFSGDKAYSVYLHVFVLHGLNERSTSFHFARCPIPGGHYGGEPKILV